jgi:thiol-disulfide isomerase/thioredoxin
MLGFANRLSELKAYKLLCLASSFVAVALQTALAELKPGEAFPDFSAFKLEGKLPESLKDKVLIVDFWASWCDPCKESFPALNGLQKKYGDKGLIIVAVNVDEERADMESFLKEHPASFTVVRDAAQKLVAKTGIKTMPSSFVLDREGKVRFAHNGFHGEKTTKQYEEQVESLLKK